MPVLKPKPKAMQKKPASAKGKKPAAAKKITKKPAAAAEDGLEDEEEECEGEEEEGDEGDAGVADMTRWKNIHSKIYHWQRDNYDGEDDDEAKKFASKVCAVAKEEWVKNEMTEETILEKYRSHDWGDVD